jgi:hypothetical protein
MMTRDLPVSAGVRRALSRMEALATEAAGFAEDSPERRACRDEGMSLLRALSPGEAREFERAQLAQSILRMQDRTLELLRRVKELEAAVANGGGTREGLGALVREAEEGLPLKWLGTWNAEEVYRAGSVTCYNSSLWVATEPDTTGRPGTTAPWRMILRTPDLRGRARDRGGR